MTSKYRFRLFVLERSKFCAKKKDSTVKKIPKWVNCVPGLKKMTYKYDKS